MLKAIYTSIFIIFFCTSTWAQQGSKANKIDELKIKFVVNKLNLSSQDSEQFYPVYQSYLKKINQILYLKRKARQRNTDNPEKSIDDDFSYDMQLLELRKAYKREFLAILSAQQLKDLYAAERSFREELIKQLKNN